MGWAGNRTCLPIGICSADQNRPKNSLLVCACGTTKSTDDYNTKESRLNTSLRLTARMGDRLTLCWHV